MSKARLGTIWLDACSGCHMSTLDMDELLFPVADKIEVLYSPLVDAKEMPEELDVFLVTGAASTEEDIEKLHEIRRRTKVLVAMGDCAVTGNVPAMRNLCGREAALERAYNENVTVQPQVPHGAVPTLLDRVHPVHEIVQVDEFIQGCPPGAQLIHFILNELLQGRIPGRGIRTKFG